MIFHFSLHSILNHPTLVIHTNELCTCSFLCKRDFPYRSTIVLVLTLLSISILSATHFFLPYNIPLYSTIRTISPFIISLFPTSSILSVWQQKEPHSVWPTDWRNQYSVWNLNRRVPWCVHVYARLENTMCRRRYRGVHIEILPFIYFV